MCLILKMRVNCFYNYDIKRNTFLKTRCYPESSTDEEEFFPKAPDESLCSLSAFYVNLAHTSGGGSCSLIQTHLCPGLPRQPPPVLSDSSGVGAGRLSFSAYLFNAFPFACFSGNRSPTLKLTPS